MRWLLLMLIAVLAVGDIFSMDLSLATGLSLKNAMLYLVVVALVFRTCVSGELKMGQLDVHALFAVWIGYAAVTLFLAAFVIHYPGYHLGDALITLKTNVFDTALFCFAALWGLRDERDVRVVVSALAAVMAISSVFTLLDVRGIIHLNIYIGDSGVQEGRVFGVFGHANETGTLLACFLPALFAQTTSARGFPRLLWVIGTTASIAVFLMTISRGAFAGLFVGLLWGGYLCRRYVPLQRLVLWAVIIVVAVPIALAIASAVDPYLRGYLADRLFGQSMGLSLGEISSGRTGLWMRIVDQMMDAPASLLFGFGWNVYSTTPYMLPTHNHYLDLWFNLGLVGVGVFVLIMRRGIVAALHAIPLASERDRPMFVAYVLGMLALLVAIIFANLFRPWPYIWIYFGAMLRGALLVQTRAVERPVAVTPAAAPQVRTAGGVAARPQPAITWSRRG
ncbi:MAG: O-antigen ligase family protein [Steroidobacteraceae bacterium]